MDRIQEVSQVEKDKISHFAISEHVSLELNINFCEYFFKI